jgi:hypothetical protein
MGPAFIKPSSVSEFFNVFEMWNPREGIQAFAEREYGEYLMLSL